MTPESNPCPTCGQEKRAVTSRTPEGAWKCGCGGDEQRARELLKRLADIAWAVDKEQAITAALAEARADALEEAAQVAERESMSGWIVDCSYCYNDKAPKRIAEYLRTLARSGKEQSG
jgi:hypothetical protein